MERGVTVRTDSGPLFAIQDYRRKGVARLALRGELDVATAPELEEHLMLVERDDIEAVLLDLRELTFVDSAGLQTILNARSRAAENGHRFDLVGPNEHVRKFLRMTASWGFAL